VRFPVQPLAELSIDLAGRRAIARLGQDPHQGALGRLAEGVNGGCPPQVLLGRRQIAGHAGGRRQLLQRRQIRLLSRLPFLEDPLLRAVFQQWPAVELDRRLQARRVAMLDRPVELQQIDRAVAQIESHRASRR
jgi:hypothetical protein